MLQKARTYFAQPNITEEESLEFYRQLTWYTDGSEIQQIAQSLKKRYPDWELFHHYLDQELILPGTDDSSLNQLKQAHTLQPDNEKVAYLLGWTYYRRKEYQKAYEVLHEIDAIQTYTNWGHLKKLALRLPPAQRYPLLKQLIESPFTRSKSGSQLNDLIKKTETELGISPQESLASPHHARHKRRQLVLGGVFSTLSILAFLFYYQMKLHSLPVYLVNGLPTSQWVQLGSITDTLIPAGGVFRFETKPGIHLVSLSGQPTSDTIPITANWIEVLFHPPTHIVNVGGAALILDEQLEYRKRGPLRVVETRAYAGRWLNRLINVDYAFERPPLSIPDATHLGTEKRALSLAPSNPETVLNEVRENPSGISPKTMLSYLEAQMRYSTATPKLIEEYRQLAETNDEQTRAETFLCDQGLATEPCTR